MRDGYTDLVQIQNKRLIIIGSHKMLLYVLFVLLKYSFPEWLHAERALLYSFSTFLSNMTSRYRNITKFNFWRYFRIFLFFIDLLIVKNAG